MQAVAANLPPGYGYEWTGTTYQEQQAQGNEGAIFGFADVKLDTTTQYDALAPSTVMYGDKGMLFGAAVLALATTSNKGQDLLVGAPGALDSAGARANVILAPDILHQVHFFIAGEAVRRSLQRTGQSYTPFVYSLNLFSDRFREAARRIWL